MKYESESREMIDLYYAEDDETVAQAVKEYLEQENFRVTVFSMLAGMKQALRSRQPGPSRAEPAAQFAPLPIRHVPV